MPVKSMGALGAASNFTTGRALAHCPNPGRCLQPLYRSPDGHLYMDVFEAMPEVTGGLRALMDFADRAIEQS